MVANEQYLLPFDVPQKNEAYQILSNDSGVPKEVIHSLDKNIQYTFPYCSDFTFNKENGK